MTEPFKPDWRNADPEELEPHFSRWMLELTAQGLHGKADIATVLAMQDTRIEELQRQLAEVKLERNMYDSAHKREAANVLRLSGQLAEAERQVRIFSALVEERGRTIEATRLQLETARQDERERCAKVCDRSMELSKVMRAFEHMRVAASIKDEILEWK